MNLSRTAITGLVPPPRFGAIAGAVIVGLLWATTARAEDWMFNRSYFSHDIPPALAHQYPRPESRSAYRPAYIGNQPGFAARGAYRFRFLRMNSGTSTDTTVFREQWLNSRMFP